MKIYIIQLSVGGKVHLGWWLLFGKINQKLSHKNKKSPAQAELFVKSPFLIYFSKL